MKSSTLPVLVVVLLSSEADAFYVPSTRPVPRTTVLWQESTLANGKVVPPAKVPQPPAEPSTPEPTAQTAAWAESTRDWFAKLDDKGCAFKPRAQNATLAAKTSTETFDTIKLNAKASLYWSVYMLYRAYRGFVVIMPAVISETYRQLQPVVDYPFVTPPMDTNPSTGTMRWRSRIFVAVASTLFAAYYVASGAVHVGLRFLKTLTQPNQSVADCFGAAAQDLEENVLATAASSRRPRLSPARIDSAVSVDNTVEPLETMVQQWNASLATMDPMVQRYVNGDNIAVNSPSAMDFDSVQASFCKFLQQQSSVQLLSSQKVLKGTEWAMDAGLYEFTAPRGDKMQAQYTYVYTVENGQWKMAHHHHSVMEPPALAP